MADGTQVGGRYRRQPHCVEATPSEYLDIPAAAVKRHHLRSRREALTDDRLACKALQQIVLIQTEPGGAPVHVRLVPAQPEQLGQGVDGVQRHTCPLIEPVGSHVLGKPGILRCGARIHAKNGRAQGHAGAIHRHDRFALTRKGQRSRRIVGACRHRLTEGIPGQAPDGSGILFCPARLRCEHAILARGGAQQSAALVEQDSLAAGGADVKAQQRHRRQ